MQKQYAAGIVLYNPELNRLKQNLDAVSSQVKTIYCYNNGLRNEKEIIELISLYPNVSMIGTGENVGIATALNELIKKADTDNIKWLLTLDQDSVVCEGMIEALASLTEEERVAIICPLIEDIRRKNEKQIVVSDTHEDVDFCITSGSFMNVKCTLRIGGFDDYLFIGLVDNEICYRVKLNNLRIVRNNAVKLNHELGNLIPSKLEKFYLKLGTILHCNAIKKLSYKREVSPMRVYYATRNMIYLNSKYPKNTVVEWSERTRVRSSISSVLRGKQKIQIIKSIRRGIKDGKNKVKSSANEKHL